MIDFTNCEINKFRYYGGRNGGKICIVYNDEEYMLKFPALIEKSEEHEYTNSCISEYICCHILQTLGLNVQQTLLGTYKLNGKEKVVVACKDFTEYGKVFRQFAELKNSQIETSKNGYGTELSEVIETIELQQIYDCASCLYPQLSDSRIAEIIDLKDGIDARIYTFPNSALKENDIKINYYEYITSLKNQDCNNALKRIVPLIDMDKINKIIDETEYISDLRKEFYKRIINERYNKILKLAYERLEG